MRPRSAVALAALALSIAGCAPDPAPPLPPDSFAFGTFGDGPYYPWEEGRWDRVIDDIARSDAAWLIHVGDLFYYPCSDEHLEERVADFAAMGRPVIYTPGDNEWTDCHDPREGGYDPLERLAAIRRILFSAPSRSLGSPALEVETQASDPAWADMVENVRWRRGGFVFATLHLVGSGNGTEPFPGRTEASDEDARHRMSAAIAWMDATFETARAAGAKGVVLSWHAEIWSDSEQGEEERAPFLPFLAALRRNVEAFPGLVVGIHGDSHVRRQDHPLSDSVGRPLANFARLETFGSPDIGWVRVVVDTVKGEITSIEPRRLRGWW